MLGGPLADEIRAADADALSDEDTRERHSVRLRRLAHATFSPRGTWDRVGRASGCGIEATPTVSVLLPSNRPDDVVEAARQVAAQRNIALQLVVGLHGSHMERELDDQLAEAFPGDLVVRHLPNEMNLGQVLNELTDEADGELISKWDDDDWYDEWHLNDLVAALEYSGAAMTAKAAEFVYLDALDLTIRRFPTSSERFSRTVAGGTLLLASHELRRRWAAAARRVDRLLIDALEDAGPIDLPNPRIRVCTQTPGRRSRVAHLASRRLVLPSAVPRPAPGLDLRFAGFEESSP